MIFFKHVLASVVALSALPACAMTCKAGLSGTRNKTQGFIHPLDEKSAVVQLDLTNLRDSTNPAVQTWIKDHNERTIKMLNSGKDDQLDTLAKVITDRAKEIFPTNTPPVAEVGEDQIMTKGGKPHI